jgi:glycosyltransferase involved in cell wall biosynthesis
MELFSMRREGKVLGSISVVTRDHINAATVTSLVMTDFRWLPKGATVDHNIIQGSILTSQRNECIQRMRGDWLLYIDDDMVWRPDAIGKLVEAREEHDLDMIGGLCFRRSEPYHPTMYMREGPTEGGYNFLEDWVDGEIKEVDATGCAFLLIHKRVFEMIADGPMPPYEERMREGGPPPNFFRWEGTYGEDLRFCQDAKKAGARIWVHTGIPVDHIAEVKITYRDFLTQLRQRDEATWQKRKKLNDAMGLPTLTRAEVKKRLGW